MQFIRGALSTRGFFDIFPVLGKIFRFETFIPILGTALQADLAPIV
jgi:hypothetical protein